MLYPTHASIGTFCRRFAWDLSIEPSELDPKAAEVSSSSPTVFDHHQSLPTNAPPAKTAEEAHHHVDSKPDEPQRPVLVPATSTVPVNVTGEPDDRPLNADLSAHQPPVQPRQTVALIRCKNGGKAIRKDAFEEGTCNCLPGYQVHCVITVYGAGTSDDLLCALVLDMVSC